VAISGGAGLLPRPTRIRMDLCSNPLWGGGARRLTGGNKGGVRLAEKEGKRVGRRASWSRWARSKGKSPGGRKVGGRERGPGATKAYCEFGISSLGVFNLYILM